VSAREPLLGIRNHAPDRLHKLIHSPLVREGLPVLGLYWLYSAVRWLVAHENPYAAFANAYRVIRLERDLGIFIEPVLQRWLIDHALGVVHVANWFYTLGYFPVLLGAAVLLYRSAPGRFQTLKFTFLLGLGLALVCYSLFPLAPPRMLTGAGLVDTGVVYGSDLYNQRWFISLYNPYAAMPSLHFGWALLVGLIVWDLNRLILRVWAVLYPCAMAVAIVTTGHHYLVDIAAGGLIVGSTHGLVKWLTRDRRAPSPAPV
jgi:hypothetical protein